MKFAQKTAAVLLKSLRLDLTAELFIEPLFKMDKLGNFRVALIDTALTNPLHLVVPIHHESSWLNYARSPTDSIFFRHPRYNVGVLASALIKDFPDAEALDKYLVENWRKASRSPEYRTPILKTLPPENIERIKPTFGDNKVHYRVFPGDRQTVEGTSYIELLVGLTDAFLSGY